MWMPPTNREQNNKLKAKKKKVWLEGKEEIMEYATLCYCKHLKGVSPWCESLGTCQERGSSPCIITTTQRDKYYILLST